MRKICTKEAPYKKDGDWHWQHPDAKSVGECLDGCCDYYECPNCGLHFTVEVGQ